MKRDGDKPRWDLLPFKSIARVVDVLTFGAKVYAVDNWQVVEEPRRRYFAAAMRHLVAWHGREVLDADSKLPHLAHAACDILFLLWFDEEGR